MVERTRIRKVGNAEEIEKLGKVVQWLVESLRVDPECKEIRREVVERLREAVAYGKGY